MIVETLVAGSSLFGCMWCWAMVQKARISAELQKHKMNTDLEVLRPEPTEPAAPSFEQQVFESKRSALNAVMRRRTDVEEEITRRRDQVNEYSGKAYESYRADALKSLENARDELALLVKEEQLLIHTLQGENDVEPRLDTTAQPIRVDPGGSVAQRMVDLGLMHDAEPDEPEASRTGAA